MGQISRHSAVFFAGTMFTIAAGYLFKIFLARVLGAEGLGIYALGMTVGGVLGLIAAIGIPQAAARYVAVYAGGGRYADLRGFLWRTMNILILSNVVVAAVMMATRRWVALRIYHTPILATYMGAFAMIMVLGTFVTFFGQVMAGLKDVARRTVITNFIGSPLTMLVSVALLILGMGLKGYLLAQIVSSALVVALLATSAWKLMPLPVRSATDPLPGFEQEALWFSASLFAVQSLEFVFAQVDKVLLGYYLDARSVGIYAVAASVTAFLPLVLQSVNQIFSPTIADLHARGEMVLLQRLYRTLTKWVLGLTLPLAIVVCVFAPQLMQIFGTEFRPGWPVLLIGTLGQLINCGVGSVGLLLIMSGNQNRLIRVQVKVAVVTVLLNLILIPVAGIIGAAIVSAGTNAAINLLYLREVRQSLGLKPYGRSIFGLVQPIALVLALVIVLRFELSLFPSAVVAILVSLVLTYTAFIALAYWVGLDADDRLIAAAVWARVRGALTIARAEA
jgi:O-antigen/teichoic acid export membrane protein